VTRHEVPALVAQDVHVREAHVLGVRLLVASRFPRNLLLATRYDRDAAVDTHLKL